AVFGSGEFFRVRPEILFVRVTSGRRAVRVAAGRICRPAAVAPAAAPAGPPRLASAAGRVPGAAVLRLVLTGVVVGQRGILDPGRLGPQRGVAVVPGVARRHGLLIQVSAGWLARISGGTRLLVALQGLAGVAGFRPGRVLAGEIPVVRPGGVLAGEF